MGYIVNRQKRSGFKWIVVAILCLFVTVFGVGIWFISSAWFQDRDAAKSSVTLATLSVNSNTNEAMSKTIWVALKNQQILSDDVTFGVEENSADLFLRAGIFVTTKNATSQVAKDIIKFQSFMPSQNAGHTWVRDGEWFYFCNANGTPAVLTNKSETIKFMSKDAFVIPNDLHPDSYGEDDTVDLKIRVEAVQSRNVESGSCAELAPYFTTQYPTNTFSVKFHNESGAVIKTEEVGYAGDVTPPEITGEGFECWNTLQNGRGANVSGAEFQNITQDLNLYPKFRKTKCVVSVVITGEEGGGAVEPGSATVGYGESSTFKIVAATGFKISSISRSGEQISITDENEQTVVLENIIEDETLTVKFEKKKYTIHVSSYGDGITTPEKNTSVEFGSNQEFTFEANTGSYISSLLIDGAEQISKDQTTSTSHTFSKVASDHNVAVIYSKKVYSVTATCNGFGTVTQSTQEVEHDGSATLTLTARAGAYIKSIEVNGEVFGEPTTEDTTTKQITISNITEDKTIVVDFQTLWSIESVDTSEGTKFAIREYLGAKTDITIPSVVYAITENVNIFGVTGIGKTNLTSVTFSDGIEMIGTEVFKDCTDLTSVTLPNSLIYIGRGAFVFCYSLSSITFPESLENIGVSAFEACTSLTSITFPESLENIGNGAFYACSGITSITFKRTTAPTIGGAYAFSGVLSTAKIYVANEGYISALSEKGFAENTYMYDFEWQKLAKCRSEDGVFKKIYWITISCGPNGTNTYVNNNTDREDNINKPEAYDGEDFSVTFTANTNYVIQSIKDNGDQVKVNGNPVKDVQSHTHTITKVSADHAIDALFTPVHHTVTIVMTKYGSCDKSTFSVEHGSSATLTLTAHKGAYIESITANETIIFISTTEDTTTKTITISNITSDTMVDVAFRTLWKIDEDNNITGYLGTKTDLTVPYVVHNGTKNVNVQCVKGLFGATKNGILNTDLKSLKFSDNIYEIGEGVFSGCINLKSVTLPEGIHIIGESAFKDCSSLTSIVFHKKLSNIGDDAFSGCTNLTSITFEGATAPTIGGAHAFSGVPSTAKIYVANEDYISALSEKGFAENTHMFLSTNKTKKLAKCIGGNFKKIYWITISCGQNGTATIDGKNVSGDQEAYDGEDFSVTFTANTNHVIQSITDNGAPVTAGGNPVKDVQTHTHTITNVTADHTMAAKFTLKSYELTVKTNKFGRFKTTDDESYDDDVTFSVQHGGLASFTFDAALGAYIKSIEVNGKVFGEPTTEDTTTKTITISNITEDKTIVVDFQTLWALEGSNITGYLGTKTDITIPSRVYDGTEVVNIFGVTGIGKTNPKSVTFSDGIEEIGRSVFRYTDLTSVTLPKTLTTIGEFAFAYCAITSITVPGSLTTLGEAVFGYCNSLANATLSEGLNKIGRRMFDSCTNLASITFEGAKAPTVDNTAFSGVKSTCKIYIPNGSLDSYAPLKEGGLHGTGFSSASSNSSDCATICYSTNPTEVIAKYEDKKFKRIFKGITMDDSNRVYDGEEKSISINQTPPEGASVSYTIREVNKELAPNTGNAATEAGTYEITAILTGDYYIRTEISATLTITKYSVTGVVFNNAIVTYDGKNHKISVTDEQGNVLENYKGAQITYYWNSNQLTSDGDWPKNAGTHTITAKFEGYPESENKTATLTINKTDFDMTGVVFNDATVTYDGKNHKISVTDEQGNVLENYKGAQITYYWNSNQLTSDGDWPKNAGTHTITAQFSNINYKTKTLEATLTIKTAEFTLRFTKIGDETFTYDATAHDYTATAAGTNTELQAPKITYTVQVGETTHTTTSNNIKITDTGVSIRDAGTYTITASINETDYAYTSISKKVTINKADFTVSINPTTLTYNGYNQTLLKSPENITVAGVDNETGFEAGTQYFTTCENNSQKNAGTYNVTLKVYDSKYFNYNDYKTTVEVTINKAKPEFRPSYVKVYSGMTFINKPTSTYNDTVNYEYSSDYEKAAIVKKDEGKVTITKEVCDRSKGVRITVAETSNTEAASYDIILIPFVLNDARNTITLYTHSGGYDGSSYTDTAATFPGRFDCNFAGASGQVSYSAGTATITTLGDGSNAVVDTGTEYSGFTISDENITTIQKNAFLGANLHMNDYWLLGKVGSTITIGNSVTMIDDYAFSGCNNCSFIIFNGDVTTIKMTAFNINDEIFRYIQLKEESTNKYLLSNLSNKVWGCSNDTINITKVVTVLQEVGYYIPFANNQVSVTIGSTTTWYDKLYSAWKDFYNKTATVKIYADQTLEMIASRESITGNVTFESNGYDYETKISAGSYQGSNTTYSSFKVEGGNLTFNDPNLTLEGYSGASVQPLITVSSGTFTMSGGTLTGNTATNGGAVYVDGGTFDMIGGTIQNCTATESGGGVYVQLGSYFNMSGGEIYGCAANGTADFTGGGGIWNEGTAEITEGIINGCHATKHGGGIFNVDRLIIDGSAVKICNCYAGTGSYDGWGGGVFNEDGGWATLTNGTITDCYTYDRDGSKGQGGGVYTRADFEMISSFNITGCHSYNGGGMIIMSSENTKIYGTISSCTATTGDGGGIYCYGSTGTIEVYGKIEGNTAKNGGGVYVASGKVDFLSATIITSNTATNNGGGIYAKGSSNVTIYGQISENTATNNGGGVYLYEVNDTVQINDATITGNTASKGEIMYAYLCKKIHISGNTNLNGTLMYRDGEGNNDVPSRALLHAFSWTNDKQAKISISHDHIENCKTVHVSYCYNGPKQSGNASVYGCFCGIAGDYSMSDDLSHLYIGANY